jgi:hypothetical protein
LYFAPVFAGLRNTQTPENSRADREARNFNCNLRELSDDFAPFSFIQL